MLSANISGLAKHSHHCSVVASIGGGFLTIRQPVCLFVQCIKNSETQLTRFDNSWNYTSTDIFPQLRHTRLCFVFLSVANQLTEKKTKKQLYRFSDKEIQ